MNISVESIFPSYKPKEIPAQELRFLLNLITAEIPSDQAYIYEYNATSNKIKLLVSESFDELSPQEQDRVCDLVREHVITELPNIEPQIITLNAVDNASLQSALLYPFSITDTLSGVLSLFSVSSSAYQAEQFPTSAPLV